AAWRSRVARWNAGRRTSRPRRASPRWATRWSCSAAARTAPPPVKRRLAVLQLALAVGRVHVHVLLTGKLRDGGHHLLGDQAARLGGRLLEDIRREDQRLADPHLDSAGAGDHLAGRQDAPGA